MSDRLEPWSSEQYRRRTRGSVSGHECVLCGKDAKDSAFTVLCSPVTGDFCRPGETEASLYQVGADCARKLKNEPVIHVYCNGRPWSEEAKMAEATAA